MIEISEIGDLLRDVGRPKTFGAGETIIREGDVGETVYFVRRGVVELLVGEQLLDILEPGSIFGEMSVIDGEPRSATAVATADCELMEVDHGAFEALLDQQPEVAVTVMCNMAKRLRRLNEVVATR